MTPSTTVRDRILASAAKQPSRTRAEGRLRAGVAYGLAILASILYFESWGGISHSAGRPKSLTFAIAGGATLMALAASSLGFWRGRSMTGRSQTLLALGPLLLPWATLAWLFLFHGRYVEPFARIGWRCAGLGFGCGAALLAAIVWVRKRTIARHATLHGAALGATAAAWSAILIDLWCPLTNVPHALVGHVMPIVGITLVGALLGRLVLGIRPR